MIQAGTIVEKKSKKPFPGGKKVNKVIGLTVNPYTGKDAAILEDGNIVETRMLIEKL